MSYRVHGTGALKCQMDCAVSLCMCPRSNHGDPLGCGDWYGDWHSIVRLISLGARPTMEYGQWGKKRQGGLDSGQSTSVNSARCALYFQHCGCPVVRLYLLYASKDYYRPRRRVYHWSVEFIGIYSRTSSPVIQKGSFDFGQIRISSHHGSTNRRRVFNVWNIILWAWQTDGHDNVE